MAQSGISVPQDVIDTFNKLKIDRKYKYMVITLQDNAMKYKTGDSNRGFEQFKKEFNTNTACYGIYDSETKKKLILVHWNPNDAPVKNRMLTSTTLKGKRDHRFLSCNLPYITFPFSSCSRCIGWAGNRPTSDG